ncbi:uncharacterized protein LOC115072729 [Nannospalax galili]|uniref:uncharacterized protein LOC115072729 n=1 Tax=Nannospalax galili TaxID=1026970 RepID=UPI00111C1D42|nr:uncharacterized protein LOC115072729 [Nannospalax galili]
MHTHSHCAVPQKGADTQRAHTSAAAREPAWSGTPTATGPGTGARPPRGLGSPRMPSSECFPTWPAWSLGIGPQKCGRSHWGVGGVGTACSLPANSPAEKLFVARAGWPKSPPPAPLCPLPVLPPERPGRSAAAQCPASGGSVRLAAGRRGLDPRGAGRTGGLLRPRRVRGQTPGRRTISVLSVQECGSRGGGGGGRAAAAWAVGRQGSPEGAPSPLRSSRSVREPSRTQRGELEEKKGRKGKERGRERE